MVPPLTPLTAGSGSLVDDIFGNLWVDAKVPPRRWVLLACVAIGVFAGLSLPFSNIGLAATLMLVAAGVLVLVADPAPARAPFTWACAVLCARASRWC